MARRQRRTRTAATGARCEGGVRGAHRAWGALCAYKAQHEEERVLALVADVEGREVGAQPVYRVVNVLARHLLAHLLEASLEELRRKGQQRRRRRAGVARRQRRRVAAALREAVRAASRGASG
jgi:hypothetical protein